MSSHEDYSNLECELQRLRWKRLLPISALALGLFSPSKFGGLKFIPIYEAITIRAQKNSPPHLAFESLKLQKQKSEWANFEKIPATPLTATPAFTSLERSLPEQIFAKKILLPKMVLQKDSEVLIAESQATSESADYSWIDSLTPTQAKRLEAAQSQSEVLDQNWQEPSLSDQALVAIQNVDAEIAATSGQRVYVATAKSGGNYPTTRASNNARGSFDGDRRGIVPNVPEDDDGQVGLLKNRGYKITGKFEIRSGLGLTNDHHIEIRRNDEGIFKELGRVNIEKALYSIEVEEPTGVVVGRLVDKEGRTIGEGKIRLNPATINKNVAVNGPMLKLEPHQDFGGVLTSAYNSRPEEVAPAKTTVTFVKGASETQAKRDGTVSMQNVAKGSTTVMRAAAPGHLQTSAIIVSGHEFKSQLYPGSMIDALQEIVSQQQMMSLDKEKPAIIWGRAALDGKTIAGIEVVVESDPNLVPIYFNAFMIPDANLKATSDNGLFAFVNVTEGFHSLLATRAGTIFGYQNVVVEEGAVAQGDIDSTIKKESVPLRVYDAFMGTAKGATVTLQSLDEEIVSALGTETLLMPNISRLGLMKVQPIETDYLAARYLYNDADPFIHIPLIQWQWLNNIRTYLKMDDVPGSGTVVGFVPDEDFEVYLAGFDNFNPRQIVYFDMQGRILQNGKGTAGGGFILFNVTDDIHEVVVLGSRSQKIFSKVLPVDPESLSVLLFRE